MNKTQCWLNRAVADAVEITRYFVNELSVAVANSNANPSGHSTSSAPLTTPGSMTVAKTADPSNVNKLTGNAKAAASPVIKTRYTVIRIKHETRPAQITLTRRASAVGFGWIQYLDDGSESEIDLATATLDALL